MIEFELEPSLLIGPSATIIAILLAGIAFVAARMAARLRLIQDRLAAEDIPDQLRRHPLFLVATYVEPALYLGIVAYGLYSAYQMWWVIWDSVNYYRASVTGADETIRVLNDYLAREGIATDFSNAILRIPFILIGVGLVIAWELVPLPIPALVRAYLRSMRGLAVGVPTVDKMRDQAMKSFEAGDFHSSILLGTAALEFSVRSLIGAREPISWLEIVRGADEFLMKRGAGESQRSRITSLLHEIRHLRNRAAHPTPETSFSEGEAKWTLDTVGYLMDWLLGRERLDEGAG